MPDATATEDNARDCVRAWGVVVACHDCDVRDLRVVHRESRSVHTCNGSMTKIDTPCCICVAGHLQWCAESHLLPAEESSGAGEVCHCVGRRVVDGQAVRLDPAGGHDLPDVAMCARDPV